MELDEFDQTEDMVRESFADNVAGKSARKPFSGVKCKK
jgi:hypothetical protein